MNQEETPIIPKEYYEQLVAIGRENLCEGKYVEGMGYILPEIRITAIKQGEWETFYNISVTNNVVVVDPNNPKTIPFFILESKYKSIYEHHIKAITTKNKPTFLTYDSNQKKAGERRSTAIRFYPTMFGFDRDEYPYACTMQGGAGASVEYVPLSENRSHGRYIRTITNAFNMKTGDIFEVIPIPDDKPKEPRSVPNPVPLALPVSEKQKNIKPFLVSAPSSTEIVEIGTAAAIMATILKILDIIGSKTVAPLFIMPMDPSLYQNQQNIMKGDKPTA